MDLPAISETCVWQAYARLPSICTMQAPHRPVPQPNLVPVSLRPSRITHNNGVCGGASVVAAWPFTVKLVAMVSSRNFPRRRPRHGVCKQGHVLARHPALADEHRASHAELWV